MSEFIGNEPQSEVVVENAVDTAALKRQASRAYNRLGWGLVIMVASMLVLPNLVYIVVGAIAPAVLSSPFFSMPLTYICMYLIGLPLMLLVLRGVLDMPVSLVPQEGKKLGVGTVLALYPVLYAVLTVFNYIAMAIESLIGTSATTTTQDIVATGMPLWITFVIGVIVAPIMEELVFRHLVYKKAAAYGRVAYVLWTAIMFGLFHLNFGQSLYAAALGAVFAIVMIRTGSVRYTIILHMMVNVTGGVGIGGIILSSGSELALTIYGYYCLALAAVGVIIGIIMLVRMVKTLKAAGPEKNIPKAGTAFLNPGTLVYCAICLFVIVALFAFSAMG